MASMYCKILLSDNLQPTPQHSSQVTPSTNTQNESANQPTQPAQKPSATTQARIVLYKGAFMRPFRLLVRFKIFQLVGIASLAIPINTFLVEVDFSSSICPSSSICGSKS